MNDTAEIAGTAIQCDLDGTITRVVYDRLGIAGERGAGRGLSDIVDPASRVKAAGLVAAICKDGGAFDWQLCVPVADRLALLHCMGFREGDGLWIVLAHTEGAAAGVLEEMSLIQNEQTTMLRTALKQASQNMRAAQDDSQFQELTGLYNDLGRIQRELAQRNAELEALRAKLEAKQAELMDANAKLDALATTDGLTGVANRRAFQTRLEAECARVGRHAAPLSLIMFDVDHFKSLNDTHGHPAGDEVLKALGRILASSSRSTDLAARYGGEEFTIILVNTGLDAAREAASRLRAAIEAEPWRHRAVTASFGVASFGPGAESPSDLIGRADKALYFSKTHGRNRVTTWVEASAEEGATGPLEARASNG